MTNKYYFTCSWSKTEIRRLHWVFSLGA